MKQYLARLKEWFSALEQRERMMVGACSVFTVFTLLYLGLWQPLAGAHDQRQQALDSARSLATRLEVIAAQAIKAGAGGTASASVNRSMSLLSAVDQAGKSGTLNKPPSRLQPEGDLEVKVWLEDVNFDGVVRWIAELETRYGVIAQTVDIEKQSTPGLVNARLSLIRP